MESTDEADALRKRIGALRLELLRLQTFDFAGQTYSYVTSTANRTWDNERAVELPIVGDAVAKATGDVLEVGNVLRNYFPISHRVVDKYEKGRGVENLDVTEIEGSYDLIVSVSTLEHVGFSEGLGAEKAVEAVRHLRGCLAPGGRLLFTVPVGYNRALDAAIGEGIPSLDARFLRRLDCENRWSEASSWDHVSGLAYGRPFPAANAIVVGQIRV